ncbi:Serine-aspartate repeat-containing protein I precursor [Botrimarina colliarenosi]|uniref:Serine-aspartate repeat-containing protein I n=1 Tax=Botrimarina colliarenosi TaxID=2528001 RepID=A0A5C6ALB7_9BACT|nr:SdrD B-like domain-containing protein [Botrimarina colliarenosi]TWT99975.1 Serine-aspartate repeat-containing protein I precursor [Botrimarina colliarenosi]
MRKPRPSYRRSLRHFELLEGRRLLATDLAQIAGFVRNDLDNDGVDDVVAVSQQVELFLDNGTTPGVFDLGDTSQGTTTTNASGAYSFDGLVAGDYFVRVNPTTGTQTRSGENVSALISFDATEAMGTTNLTIDAFDTAQSANASTAGLTTASDADGVNAGDGGARDLLANIVSGSGEIALVSDFVGTGILNLATTGNVRGAASVVWDGADGDAETVDAGGLSLDLSNSGANSAIELQAAADRAGASVTVRLYSGAGNVSEATVTIVDDDAAIDGDADESISIPFTSFTTVSGAGVDLSDVGAIEVEFDFDAPGFESLDAQVDVVGVLGYTTKTADFTVLNEMSLGDQVWLDLDNDGVFDPGETGVAGVALTLFEDSDGDDSISGETQVGTATTASDGTYLFSSLLPGDYLVRVDASNFTGSGALVGKVTSTGNDVAGMAPDTDVANVDDTDKGTAQMDGSVLSKGVTLVAADEPINDGDTDNDTNRTLDFGFMPFDLTITKVDDDAGATLAPGDTVTYTIVATNSGPAPAANVTVTDVLPAGLTFVSAGSTTPTTNTAVGSTTELTFDFASIASGDTETITIVATIDSGFVGAVTNNVSVAAPGEVDVLTNTATASSTVAVPLGSINGKVVVDINGNNVRDAGDLPIQGVVISLFDAMDQLVDTAVTDAMGCYEFTGLVPGVYRVVQTQPTAFADSNQTTGSTGANASGTNTITGIQVDAGNNIPVGPDNDFLEGLPTISKRRFFWSTGLFNALN